jgi:predicted transcriptional regulator
MSRDPSHVINEILPLIPEEMKDLRSELEVTQKDLYYLPPEFTQPVWCRISELLRTYLHLPPTYAWEDKIHAIMRGKKEEVELVVAGRIGKVTM